jgi:hypothetical protein
MQKITTQIEKVDGANTNYNLLDLTIVIGSSGIGFWIVAKNFRIIRS